MMSHVVKRIGGNVFRLPLACTAPYNGDFDGDGTVCFEVILRSLDQMHGRHRQVARGLQQTSVYLLPVHVVFCVSGDEMNAHVPQSLAAAAELEGIMAVRNQIVSPENNGVMISLCQDSLLSVYLLTRDDHGL